MLELQPGTRVIATSHPATIVRRAFRSTGAGYMVIYDDEPLREYFAWPHNMTVIDDTSDLDTQPITPIDDGADTIILPRLDEGR